MHILNSVCVLGFEFSVGGHGRRVQGGDRNRELCGVVDGAVGIAEEDFPQPDRSAPRCRRYAMQTHRREPPRARNGG